MKAKAALLTFGAVITLAPQQLLFGNEMQAPTKAVRLLINIRIPT